MKTLRGYLFTLWIIAAVAAAMLFPDAFRHWGSIDLSNKMLMLAVAQAVMFSMGTHIHLRDFADIAKAPWGVLVGILCHYTIMPLVGFALTRLFSFPDEISAGIILIGSCSSGLASNVMVYLARGNLALAITITSVSTMLAPIMTPLWMKLLAQQFVPVDFFDMMMYIVKMVLVPIGAALLHDFLKHAAPLGRRIVVGMALLAVAWLAYLFLIAWASTTGESSATEKMFLTISALVAETILLGTSFHYLTRVAPWLERLMPRIAMFGIIYFTAVTTAAGRDELLKVGAMLLFAAALHNTLGYSLGYWLSRILGLDRQSARTVAFEVGLQNGAMATGIASSMGKLGTVGLPAAIFSPWMNVSGSILANYWRKRPVINTPEEALAK
jgi:bile acid:Na+ symporter, BASS family